MIGFLLEIGTEEIPHWMIPGALEQLKSLVTASLFKQELLFFNPVVDGTPRRLVLRMDVNERSDDRVESIKGPAIGSPERAVRGFLSKHKVAEHDLRDVDGYYQLTKINPGQRALAVFADILPRLILRIEWPKAMYWAGGKTGPRFIRPIRWIVALLGNEVIPFEIAGVKSGLITKGHRQLGSSSIPVTTSNYEAELRKNGVILSFDERFQKIDGETQTLGAKRDHSLIGILSNMTEWPTAIRGDFDPVYLDLPSEILTTVMRVHQRYFSIVDEDGFLAPHFVAVMNTRGDPDGLIKRGNERVLRARFNDARFFWNVDQQQLLADRVQNLEHVTFLAKLGSEGSYLKKTERIEKLVVELGGDENAQRAARLCKADLTTEMVKEFTDLQGIVGGRYAKAQGEDNKVWGAIYEHYRPLSMDDPIPLTPEGRLIALADKLDTLRECFKIGLIPTGSKDPFALRRAAQGVVRILVEAKLDYKLDDLVTGDLREFLLDRIKYFFREIRGFKYDEVNAVLASGCGTLSDVEARLTALAAVRPTEDFEPLAGSFKRIQNILKQAAFEPREVLDQSLLEEGPERALHADFVRVRDAAKIETYPRALEQIASLRPRVDLFFDKVLVNAKDERVRNNRLTLLHNLLTEFSTIADFSEIVTSGDHK